MTLRIARSAEDFLVLRRARSAENFFCVANMARRRAQKAKENNIVHQKWYYDWREAPKQIFLQPPKWLISDRLSGRDLGKGG